MKLPVKFQFIDLSIDKKLTVDSGQLTVKVSALPTILNHFAKQNTETINYQLSTVNSDDGNAARAANRRPYDFYR